MRSTLLNMTWTEVQALDWANTVWVMVVGPTEQHGPHLPLGTDVFVAQAMAERVMRFIETEVGWSVVEVPGISYVPAVLSRHYPGSVSIRKRHYRVYLQDILGSYAANGLSQGILVSTHIDPPFVRETQAACLEINERYGVRFIHGYEKFPLEDLISGRAENVFGQVVRGDVHAGVLESSAMLAVAPELVRHEVMVNLSEQSVAFGQMAELQSFRDLGNGLGYTGKPPESEARYGEIWLEHYGSLFLDVVRDYCAGQDVFDRLAIGE